MLNRCRSTGSAKWYADKGISVCDRWKTFVNFLEDMGEPESNDLTLDRIENSKGYFKENCRWATWEVQLANRTLQRGVASHMSKLTDSDVLEMRELYSKGIMNQKQLGAKYGISQSSAGDVVNRISYKEVA